MTYAVTLNFLIFAQQRVLFVAFGIVFVVIVLGVSLRTLALSHSNEAKLNRIIDTLSKKYPEIKLEVQTLSTHQELASAPVYLLARFLTFIFGSISSTFIMLVDKVVKSMLSAVLVGCVAYLFLKQDEGARDSPAEKTIVTQPGLTS